MVELNHTVVRVVCGKAISYIILYIDCMACLPLHKYYLYSKI